MNDAEFDKEVFSYLSQLGYISSFKYLDSSFRSSIGLSVLSQRVIDEIHDDLMKRKDMDIPYVVRDRFVFSMVRKDDSDTSYLIGPVKVLPIDTSETRKMKFEFDVDDSEMEKFIHFIISSPVLPLNYFLHICSFVHFCINREKAAIVPEDTAGLDRLYNEYSSNKESYKLDFSNTNDSYRFENNMVSFIESGNPKGLRKFFESSTIGKTGRIAFGELRQEKNNSIISITLSTRAAIRGGLDTETAFAISDLTIQRIEASNDLPSIDFLTYNTLLDLAERVREIGRKDNISPLVNRAVKYISEHSSEKLTVEEIAMKLNTNRSFLSNRFSIEMETSMNEYINHQKVNEAKRLLYLTDKPLSEIANFLSFSSQSHFNTTFKKITGMTPLSYRQQSKVKGVKN